MIWNCLWNSFAYVRVIFTLVLSPETPTKPLASWTLRDLYNQEAVPLRKDRYIEANIGRKEEGNKKPYSRILHRILLWGEISTWGFFIYFVFKCIWFCYSVHEVALIINLVSRDGHCQQSVCLPIYILVSPFSTKDSIKYNTQVAGLGQCCSVL